MLPYTGLELEANVLQFIKRLFAPEPVVGSKLDGSSWSYFQRLERANLPYRTFNETVGRIVPGSTKEGQSAPPPPKRGTRASREFQLA